MDNIAGASLNALEIAGSLCGVPYVGAAATLLQGIVSYSNQVAGQKRKSRQLANKCTRLLLALRDQTSRLEGTELLQVVDEVTAVLEKVHKRLKAFSDYNRVKSFVKNKEIQDGLDQCEIEVTDTIDLFQVNSNILLYQSHRDSSDLLRSDTAELRDLLYQILSSQQEMRNVAEMQSAGEHVAEPIMMAGQLELRQLREGASHEHLHEPVVATILTSSPPPEPHNGERYLQYQRGLITLHKTTGIPPSVKRLNGEVTKTGNLPVAGGTYSDIWRGEWLCEKQVALKALRNIKASDPRAQTRFEHELTVWAKLQHDHILPFYGIVTDLDQNIHMVSPWQENGNVLDYVKSNPQANKINLLSGAARGIAYLHACNVIHGNVKCANILVSSSGEACICDFGMSSVIEEVTEKAASMTLTAGGSARWLAPELIDGSILSPTMEADTYSFAMAILELLTMKRPYAHRKRDASVIHDVVIMKMTPPRPKDPDSKQWLTDALWMLMEECWYSNASGRPVMSQVATRMAAMEVSEQTTF